MTDQAHRASHLVAAADLRALMRAYVQTLENARDRIIHLGGSCDSVEKMEHGDPALRRARDALAAPPVETASEIIAWRYKDARGHWRYHGPRRPDPYHFDILKPEPLYAHPQPRETRASFYVIERFENDRSAGYWTGGSSRHFVHDIESALQFVRRQDAGTILSSWHWKDCLVTGHMMVELPRQTSEQLGGEALKVGHQTVNLASSDTAGSSPAPSTTQCSATRFTTDDARCELEAGHRDAHDYDRAARKAGEGQS